MKLKLKLLCRSVQGIIRKAKLCYYISGYRKVESRIDCAEVSSIALLRWDGKLGDAIMMGVFISLLEKYRPDIKITVLVSGLPTKWIKNISNKVSILPCGKRSAKTAKSLRQYAEQFDAVLDLSSEFSYKEFLALKNIQAKTNIGYGEEKPTIYDVKIPSQICNVKERYIYAANLFIPKNSYSSLDSNELALPTPLYSSIRLAPVGMKQIAINFFGATPHRQFSYDSARLFLTNWLREWPDEVLVLLPVPDFINFLKQLVLEMDNPRLMLPSEQPSIEITLGILSESDLCFTPDTSVVHMASCLNIPTLAIYSSDERNYHEWKPLSDKNAVIFNPSPIRQNEKIKVDNFSWDVFVETKNQLLIN